MTENKKGDAQVTLQGGAIPNPATAARTQGLFVFSILCLLYHVQYIGLSWARRRCSGTGRCPFSFFFFAE